MRGREGGREGGKERRKNEGKERKKEGRVKQKRWRERGIRGRRMQRFGATKLENV